MTSASIQSASYTIHEIYQDPTTNKTVVTVRSSTEQTDISPELLVKILELLNNASYAPLISSLKNLKVTPVSSHETINAAEPTSLLSAIMSASSTPTEDTVNSLSTAAANLRGKSFNIPIPQNYQKIQYAYGYITFFKSVAQDIAKPSQLTEDDQIIEEIAENTAKGLYSFPAYDYRLSDHTWTVFYAKHLAYNHEMTKLQNVTKCLAFIRDLESRIRRKTELPVRIDGLIEEIGCMGVGANANWHAKFNLSIGDKNWFLEITKSPPEQVVVRRYDDEFVRKHPL